ncbi:hypothetical protein WMF18_28985 [Sorangium sp. So ce315]|uniref:hypothetical protein n=1 Tax=Sorangium sp. So ce315 TaxID=3133299 RepID=UPI003F62D071
MPDPVLVTVSGRVLPSVLPRLDRIAEVLTSRVPGSNMKRSDALRAAIERGVEVLERELGITPEEAAAPSTAKGGKGPARKPAKK